METIDTVRADTLEKGDIVSYEGNLYEITGKVDDDILDYLITYSVIPVTNGDDEILIFEPFEFVDIFGYSY